MSPSAPKLRRVLASFVTLGLALGVPLVATPLVLAEPGGPDFTVAPQAPHPGQTATFSATNLKPNDSVTWDFENDGIPDATGRTAQHAYQTPGERPVRMRVVRAGDEVVDVIKRVRVNAPPSASFTASPNPATVGQTVQFHAGDSSDSDGTIASYAWDLDNDGQFDDASGVTANRSFATAGTHTVTLRVTDNDGSADTATSTVTVNGATASPPPAPSKAPPPPAPSQAPLALAFPAAKLMTPFPVVRIIGRSTRYGARIKMLSVRAVPRGARVTVRCRGAGCRVRRRSIRVFSGRVRFRSFERRVRAGTRIQVFVTQPGRIGRYTSFRIRLRRAPLRTDLCVTSVTAKPKPCPEA